MQEISFLKKNTSHWLWLSVLVINFLLILGTAFFYATLPLDGSSGDSSSFTAEGFIVQRLIESRPGELLVGDIITSIEGLSIEGWLHRPIFENTWQNGKIVEYKIIRDNQPISLQIHLKPVPFKNVVSPWTRQILTILGLFSIGSFLFWKRPHDQTVRWIMFFSTTIAVQYWIDAYSIQPATLLWGWVFWFQKILDQFTYSLPYASLLLFTSAFLYPNSFLKRHPIALPSIILLSGTIIKWITMTTAPTLSAAFLLGNWVSIIPAMIQMLISFGLIIYFYRTSQNKIVLAQLRILLMGATPAALITLIYSVSLALTGNPIISQDTGITLVLLIPLSFAFAILKHQIFDIEIIINKGLLYGSLTLILGSFYIILVITLTFLLQTITLGFNQDMIVFIATLSIALLFNPLKQRIQKIIDRAFFRNKLDYNHLLPEMFSQLSRNIILEQLTDLLTLEFPRKLQISAASLQIFNIDEREEKNVLVDEGKKNAEELIGLEKRGLRIPLFIGKFTSQKEDSIRIIGQYNLGQKLSEIPYTNAEINLLTTLGQQAAISIENARLYQEVENHSHILEQRIQERTQELSDAKSIAENATFLLQKIMNNLDALIYVSDMQTGEILFANQPMLKEYGDIQGKICWQTLYKDKSSPCRTCTNSLLLNDNGTSTVAIRQEEQDAFTGLWYSTISSAIQWTDGRMVRLATRLDITEIKEAESILLLREQELTREKERRRLARDLHDTLTQSLHSLVLMADTSQRLLKKERFSDLPESMQLLSDSARQSLREMRLLLHELQLSEDKPINLQEALSTRLGIVENQIGIKTELKIDGQEYLSKTFNREIFYIVIEALNNAIKHSYAKHICVSIQTSPEKVEVIVKDNGRGFDTKPFVTQGMGFQNMKYRAEKLGGVLKIISTPRDGTELRLSVALGL